MPESKPHRVGGRYRNPWPEAQGDEALRRRIWQVALQWALGRHPPDPTPGALRVVAPDIAWPGVGPGEARITWVGHATFLVQLPGLNVLTDPVWSDRCSPVGLLGPHRFVAPPVGLEDLPQVHAVLLSHDHYDHLDRPTVHALRERFGEDLPWLTPLGYRSWFERQGVTTVVERDWWEAAPLPGGHYQAVAVPARHWTRRRPGGTNSRLWCGWAVLPLSGDGAALAAAADDSRSLRVYFAGDSGYGSIFSEIADRLGPLDVSLMPIGAYEPRWFMEAAHMNPEEAVQAYRDLGAHGAFVGMHWGTWRLTFEDPLEPPKRIREAWGRAGLPEGSLFLPEHGRSLTFRAGRGSS
jgi:N-acyl-phosphatidylethanolamine-hydrolysing phospholipase D